MSAIELARREAAMKQRIAAGMAASAPETSAASAPASQTNSSEWGLFFMLGLIGIALTIAVVASGALHPH